MASRPTAGEIADRSHGADHVIDALCFSRPSAPRVDHYLLGGEAVYELDRAAGDALLTAVPGLRDMVRARSTIRWNYFKIKDKRSKVVS